MLYPERTCPQCGAEFSPLRKDKIYCSNRCGNIFTATRWNCLHPDRRRLNQKKYESNHPDAIATSRKKSKEKNQEKIRAAGRDYYRKNRDDVLRKQKQRYAKNKTPFRESSKKWEKNNPEAILAKKHRRRAVEMGASGYCLASDMIHLSGILGNKCLKCGTENDLTWDHVIPLARPFCGSDGPANKQILCRSCNSSKGNRSSADYRTNTQKKKISSVFQGVLPCLK